MEDQRFRHRLVEVNGRAAHVALRGSGHPLLVIPATNGIAPIMPLIDALARHFSLIVTSLPGYGLSSPLPAVDPRVADYAAWAIALADSLAIGRFSLLGSHTGGYIAAEMARGNRDRIAVAVAHEVVPFPADKQMDMLANYLPPYWPRWTGTHLVDLWLRYREQRLFSPWHRPTRVSRRAQSGDDTAAIHAVLVEQVIAGANYDQAYRAVIRYDLLAAARQAVVPLVFAQPPGEDALAGVAASSPLPAAVRSVTISREDGEALAALLASDAPTWAPPPTKWVGQRILADIGDVDLWVETHGHSNGHPVVLLPSLPDGCDQHADRIADIARRRRVIAIDLPGSGKAQGPVGDPDPDRLATALMAGLDRIGLDAMDLWAIGGSAAVAECFARRAGARVRRLILEAPLCIADVDVPLARDALAPLIEPAWDGAHLLRLWHLLRNEALFTARADQRPQAVREIDPSLDTIALDRRIAGLLRHFDGWSRMQRALVNHRFAADSPHHVPTAIMPDATLAFGGQALAARWPAAVHLPDFDAAMTFLDGDEPFS